MSKYHWSRHDIDEARNNDCMFDNTFQVCAINPGSNYIEGRFMVYRRTNLKPQQSPTWYPGLDLQAELKRDHETAKEKSKSIIEEIKRRCPEIVMGDGPMSIIQPGDEI